MDADQLKHHALSHLDALYRYALRLTRHADDAEDLVQETFIRALAKADRIESPEVVRPYLFRILHNHMVDRWRAARRGPVMVSLDELTSDSDHLGIASSEPNPCAQLLREALSDEVESALASLDVSLREALWLHEVEGFSYAEISEVMEIPIGTVSSRIARARQQLAVALTKVIQKRNCSPGRAKHEGIAR